MLSFKKSSLLFLLLGSALTLRAEVNSVAGLANPLGNTGGTARATAMGSAYVAVAEDSSALLWNPAGLSGLKNYELGLHHNSWLAGIAQETVVAGVPLSSWGGLGLSFNYINFGELAAYDSQGNAAGNYGASDLGAGLGWGKEVMQGLQAGVAMKTEALTIDGVSYSAFSGDLGLLWEVAGARLGVVYANLGSPVAGSALASALRLGASYGLTFNQDNSLLLAAATQVEPMGVSRIQFGAEEVFYRMAAVRLGYEDSLADNQIKGLSGLTAGLGFTTAGFNLDYAYLPFGDLGTAQRLSLSYRFGQEATPSASPGQAATASPQDGTSLAAGQELEKQGKWRQALTVYNALILKDRLDPASWRAAGNLYYKMGKKEYAVQCYDQVLRLSPGDTALKTWLDNYRR